MSKFTAFSATDTGYVRSVNQDKALATDYLIAVADGMGGHAGGEVAAKVAIEALNAGFQEDNSTEGLLKAIRNANKTIMNRSFREQDLKGMGTTLVAAALVVDQDTLSHIVVINIGDSRAYLLPANGELSRLTEDHSLVEELVRRGEITAAQALVHPHRHILTRALGIDENVEIDAWELELDGPARVLLCSDGLTNECSEAEIGQLLRQYKNPKQAADKLVELALAHGGNDNVTVIVADIPLESFASYDNKESEEHRDQRNGQNEKNNEQNNISSLLDSSLLNESDQQSSISELNYFDDKNATIALKKDNIIQGKDNSDIKNNSPQALAAKSSVDKANKNKHVKQVVAEASVDQSKIKKSKPLPKTNGNAVHYWKSNSAIGSKKENTQLDLPSTPLTFRVVVFTILFVSIFGGAAAAVYWYLHSSYYVGIDNGYVAIFQGRPGGFLSFKPTLYQKTNLAVAKVFSPELPGLKAGMVEPSLQKAKTVVKDLGNAQSYLKLPAGNSASAAETFFVPVGATPIFTKPGVGPATTTTFIPTTTTAIPTTTSPATTLTTIPKSVSSPVTTTARLLCDVENTNPRWVLLGQNTTLSNSSKLRELTNLLYISVDKKFLYNKSGFDFLSAGYSDACSARGALYG